MIILLYLLAGYIVSILIGYFGIRKLLKSDETDPDWTVFIVVFIPLVNVIWGVISFIESDGSGLVYIKYGATSLYGIFRDEYKII